MGTLPALGLAAAFDLVPELTGVVVGTVAAMRPDGGRELGRRLHLLARRQELGPGLALLVVGQFGRPDLAVVQVPEGQPGYRPSEFFFDHYSVEGQLSRFHLVRVRA